MRAQSFSVRAYMLAVNAEVIPAGGTRARAKGKHAHRARKADTPRARSSGTNEGRPHCNFHYVPT